MKRQFCIITLIILSYFSSWACLSTYQYKIFPIGTFKGNIISVDVQIQRSEIVGAERHIDLGLNNPTDAKQMWNIKTYIAIYTKNQDVVWIKQLEVGQIKGEHYLSKLQEMYQKAYSKAIADYDAIDLFKPQSITFCNFKKECDQIKVMHGLRDRKAYLVHQNKSYELEILKDSEYVGFNNSVYFEKSLQNFYLSSSRIYTNSKESLLITHLEKGSNLFEYEKKYPYKPNIEFGNIETSVYEEPVLHHGYGFDVFVVLRK